MQLFTNCPFSYVVRLTSDTKNLVLANYAVNIGILYSVGDRLIVKVMPEYRERNIEAMTKEQIKAH